MGQRCAPGPPRDETGRRRRSARDLGGEGDHDDHRLHYLAALARFELADRTGAREAAHLGAEAAEAIGDAAALFRLRITLAQIAEVDGVLLDADRQLAGAGELISEREGPRIAVGLAAHRQILRGEIEETAPEVAEDMESPIADLEDLLHLDEEELLRERNLSRYAFGALGLKWPFVVLHGIEILGLGAADAAELARDAKNLAKAAAERWHVELFAKALSLEVTEDPIANWRAVLETAGSHSQGDAILASLAGKEEALQRAFARIWIERIRPTIYHRLRGDDFEEPETGFE